MATSLASHLAQLPIIGNMFEFPTVEALQAAYVEHLMASGKETNRSDAKWYAGSVTKYDPLFTVRGSYIDNYGYSTERDPILAASEAMRVKRYTDQGLPVPEFKGYLGGLYGRH